MGRRRWKYSYKELKQIILDGLFDVESQQKVSDREFLRLHSSELTIDGKNAYTGMWTFLTKHPEVINSEPMKGERISERTVYDYHVKMGNINPNVLSFDDFTNNTMKIKNQLDEHTLMNMNEMELLGFHQSNALPLWTRKATLMVMLDDNEEEYNKINEKNKKKLLKRTGGK